MAVVTFDDPSISAQSCELKVVLPLPKLTLTLPAIPSFASIVPKFNLHLSLSCSLDHPIDVSGGLSFGGGRTGTFDPDPDSEPDR